MIEIDRRIRIPESEIQWSFVRSGGPGGQNVNKVASKAVLRWNVLTTPSLPQSVKERLRSRHNVSVSEIGDDADLWQRASIAVVSVDSGHDPLERLFEAVIREVASQIPGDLVETGRDFLDGADGGPAGWEEESR